MPMLKHGWFHLIDLAIPAFGDEMVTHGSRRGMNEVQ